MLALANHAVARDYAGGMRFLLVLLLLAPGCARTARHAPPQRTLQEQERPAHEPILQSPLTFAEWLERAEPRRGPVLKTLSTPCVGDDTYTINKCKAEKRKLAPPSIVWCFTVRGFVDRLTETTFSYTLPDEFGDFAERRHPPGWYRYSSAQCAPVREDAASLGNQLWARPAITFEMDPSEASKFSTRAERSWLLIQMIVKVDFSEPWKCPHRFGGPVFRADPITWRLFAHDTGEIKHSSGPSSETHVGATSRTKCQFSAKHP